MRESPTALAWSALSDILASAGQMARMLDDVLMASGTRAADPTGQAPATAGVADILALAVDQVEQATGQRRVHLIRPGRPITGAWDRVTIVRAVVNLLENALKYSPDGGAVLVTVRDDGADVVIAI